MNGDLKHCSQDRRERDAIPVCGRERLTPEAQAEDLGGRVHELEHQLATLRAALDSRDMIGMAKGILIAHEKCTPDQAFDILKRASQRENRKLVEVAAELVASNVQRAMSSG